MQDVIVYTIGHSNHRIEHFIDLLRRHGIEALVDVRSAPYSRFSPHFRRSSLEASLRDAGIDYIYQGQRLGGRPDDECCYDAAGTVDYSRIANREWYREGLSQLLSAARVHRTAMMCSEENPEHCHRNLLITDTLLSEEMAGVRHIRGDGRLEEAELVPKQSRLF